MGEVCGVGAEVIRVTADTLHPDGQREGDGAFGGWGMVAGKVEVLLVVSGLDVNRSVEAKLVNIKDGDMGGGDCSGEPDKVGTVEVLKEKGIMSMSP